MGKAVLISIRPEWVEKILSGKKTLEVRKTRPTMETPFKCYIYCTLDGLKHPFGIAYGRVVGEFACTDIIEDTNGENCAILCEKGRISFEQIKDYGGNKKLYGWCISDLKIYGRPKPISDFGIARPPQSWRYVEGLQDE